MIKQLRNFTYVITVRFKEAFLATTTLVIVIKCEKYSRVMCRRFLMGDFLDTISLFVYNNIYILNNKRKIKGDSNGVGETSLPHLANFYKLQ